MSYNRLADETSPYLLQHKDNPVHWHPWGPGAFAEAKQFNKPVLLSIGYAACHWCHVMAHESFEDEATAALMNELFVNVKVDREERPDVDAIYMSALHHLGERGGWPLTMFLNSDGEPFWGGTYFPPQPRHGIPGFSQVLREVARIYSEEPDKVRHNAGLIIESLKARASASQRAALSEELIAEMAERLLTAFDPVHGGLRGAPKFPNCSILNFVWKAALRHKQSTSRAAIEQTLQNICQGGIYDHLGGGFARYTVDARWLVPHFEKMLYDNAQLITLMTEVWKKSRSPLLKARIHETTDWLLREMAAPDGGFASSYDADSEGEEGKFYVWSRDEIERLLGGSDAEFFCTIYDVSKEGNWEGHNILNRLAHQELLADNDETRLSAMRGILLEARAARIKPGFDDKVLADWNGLAITALTKAGNTFGQPHWMAAARKAYDFVKTKMIRDGRLLHSYRAGKAITPGIAPDYANMIEAAIALHQSTGESGFLEDAEAWCGVLNTQFWAADEGGYYLSASDTRDVIVRTLAAHDDAAPNANAVMLGNLAALYLLTGKPVYREQADRLLAAFSGAVAQQFVSHCGFLNGALDVMRPHHIVVIGASDSTGAAAMRQALNTAALPGAVIQVFADGAALPEGLPVSGKTAINGNATAYICVGESCSLPLEGAGRLAAALQQLA